LSTLLKNEDIETYFDEELIPQLQGRLWVRDDPRAEAQALAGIAEELAHALKLVQARVAGLDLLKERTDAVGGEHDEA